MSKRKVMTKEEVELAIQLAKEGYTLRMAAKEVGWSPSTVYSKLNRLGMKWSDLQKEGRLEGYEPANESYYVLYKGEEVIAEGTLDNIAGDLGVTKESVSFYGTPSYRKRANKGNGRVLVKIGKAHEFWRS